MWSRKCPYDLPSELPALPSVLCVSVLTNSSWSICICCCFLFLLERLRPARCVHRLQRQHRQHERPHLSRRVAVLRGGPSGSGCFLPQCTEQQGTEQEERCRHHQPSSSAAVQRDCQQEDGSWWDPLPQQPRQNNSRERRQPSACRPTRYAVPRLLF